MVTGLVRTVFFQNISPELTRTGGRPICILCSICGKEENMCPSNDIGLDVYCKYCCSKLSQVSFCDYFVACCLSHSFRRLYIKNAVCIIHSAKTFAPAKIESSVNLSLDIALFVHLWVRADHVNQSMLQYKDAIQVVYSAQNSFVNLRWRLLRRRYLVFIYLYPSYRCNMFFWLSFHLCKACVHVCLDGGIVRLACHQLLVFCSFCQACVSYLFICICKIFLSNSCLLCLTFVCTSTL